MSRASVGPLVRGVAAFGLPGAPRPFGERPLDAGDWEILLGGVRAQRLAGLLVDALVSEALPATPAQVAEAVELHAAACGAVLLLERQLLRTVALLEEASVDYRVLKGAAYAHTLYPDAGLRLYGDVDLLVPAADWDAATALLARHGYERAWPQPRAGFDRRFGKGALYTDPDGYELDLHRTFVLGPFGLAVRLEELFERVAVFDLGGVGVRALAPEERFLHTCYHAALGSVAPRLVPLRDLAQDLLGDALDTDRVLELARRWRGQAVVARAVTLAWERLGLADVVGLSVWARRYEPEAAERRALAASVGADHSYGAKTLAAVRTLPGLRARAAFVYALLVPDRAYLDARGTGYVRWWRRSGRALVQRGEVRP